MSPSGRTVGAVLFFTGCAGISVVSLPAAGPTGAVPSSPTFARDVLPIFQKSCQDCHRPGQMAPFSLVDYDSARPWVRSIKEKVVSRYMPPWHLDRSIGEYDPDPSLSDAEVATIARWVDMGAPKGDPKDAPKPRIFPADGAWQFGEEPDLVVASPGVTVPRGGPDLYPEPEAPTNLTEDRYIRWIQVMPGDRTVVHHTLVFAVQDKPSNGMPQIPGLGNLGAGSVRELTRQENGGARIITSLLTEYARGNDGDIFDSGQAKLLAAGSSIRWQFHYHPNGKDTVVDRTRVGIKFWPKGWQPKHLISTIALASPDTLAIAPGDPAARSDSYFPLAAPARLLSYQPHMHYRGRRMVLEAILPTGQVETLTDVNRFVWTWQITYPYKNRPAFPKGTVLHSIAYHDNSPANRENPDPTAFVGWGDRTIDEMNIGWIDFYYISDDEFAAIQKEQPTKLSAAPSDVGWPMHGGANNARYSPLNQINTKNVARLKVAWTYDSHDAFKGSEMQSHPVVVDGVLFATTPTMKVVALDAATGKELWVFDPSGGSGARGRFRHRGVTVHKDRVFVSYRNFLFALDRHTGQPIPSFGTGGRIDLREGLGLPVERASVSASTPGSIFEDTIIMGSSVPETLPGTPGHIRAFDVNTGRQRWIFHTIPQPGEFAYDTWPPDAYKLIGGANAWAGVTVDVKNAMVFAATGSASFDFYGVNRHGDNLFANCVLALDARTGKRVWHFQGVRHDVWDWDFPSAPTLVTVRRNGRNVEAVAQITKTGYVFVLDRKSGAPLFPIEQRPVPGSPVPGEALADTQPVPVKPPPFTRQGMTEDMITTRTPEAHAAVLERFRRFGSGMWAPPTERGIVVFPGFDGGAEWGGAAFDPDTALLYVNANEMPWIVRLIPNNDSSLYTVNCATCHREDRKGSPSAPSLEGIGERRSRDDIATIIREGTGRMPAFPDMGGRNIADLTEFLITGRDKGADPAVTSDPSWLRYRIDGETLFRDPDGYPPITPPWGTLSAIDLNAGTIRWKIPLGEYPELAARGMTSTGSDNYGGPLVTAGGLLFIGATNFDRKFRAFDKATGRLLWETTLPAAGNATPSTYAVNGKQYVVIVCGGGKNGAPSGSAIVAFAEQR